jgi:imidazolonepropionase-like amidohydrolase
MIIKRISLALLLFLSVNVYGQNTELQTPPNGVADHVVQTVAFVNAHIQAKPGLLLNNATLLIRGSKIISVGTEVTIPAEATVIDLKGKWIFPSFIELNSNYGVPDAPDKKRSRTPVMESKLAYKSYWNQAIHPEFNASKEFFIDKTKAANLRKSGFGLVLSHQKNGIARGTSVFVDLGTNRPILLERAATHYSFSKGNSSQDYPSSMMGSIALIRQFFTDFDWYRFHKKDVDLSLAAMHETHRLPMFFESRDYQENIRAQKVAKESGRSFIVVGKGDSRKDIPGLLMYNTKLVVPIVAKKAINLDRVLDLTDISLGELQNWRLAPYNPYLLDKNSVPLAITFNGHKGPKDFFASLRRTIQHGLPREAALKALTTNPASWLDKSSSWGKIEAGFTANFFISDKDLFTENAQVYQHWIRGENYQNHSLDIPSYGGNYTLLLGSDTLRLTISGDFNSPKAKVGETQSSMKSAKISWDENGIVIKTQAFVLFGSKTGKEISGHFSAANRKGEWTAKLDSFTGKKIKKAKDTPPKNEARAAFVYSSQNSTYLIKNCTVWTCDENGIVPHLDVYVKDGKISNMGENLDIENVEIIDGTGKHLSPGIIDEHSHIAIKRGVNEGSQSITAEVRIQDVVNADDVNIYRQVAGGTTTSHLLHGSANPVGGQTALIKLKYGNPVRGLLFPSDHRFIKFALGENVKQSNWGDSRTVRFPQTRMGVEQVFVDGFTRAKKYSEQRALEQVKKDWELEALAEILKSKRFITCHSYQQGEINMLMHVADSFGFTVNTFTHILEGYKVADKMKAHGVAASSFSDWWAYKFEVNDAIPFNAAVLLKSGILTGINSDDAEMGRRLNQEAAKAVKYGAVSEEDAFKMITINPAKMLHIDDRVGSVTIGKDADLVLWDGNPLSNYSKVQTTWIDGVIYFDIAQDREERERVRSVKSEILAEMRKDKSPKKEFKPKTPKLYHCDTIEHE